MSSLPLLPAWQLTKLSVQCSSGLEHYKPLGALRSLKVRCACCGRSQRRRSLEMNLVMRLSACLWTWLQPHLRFATWLDSPSNRTCRWWTATGRAFQTSCCSWASPACTCALPTLPTVRLGLLGLAGLLSGLHA